MIDTETEAADDSGTEEQRLADMDEQAAYEAAYNWYLEDDSELSWSEERALYHDEDGDLNLAREDLPSHLLVLEDFHDEFVYEVKAVFHLFEIDEDEAITALSHIVKDHVADGNNKITETTAITNLNSAADCPNRKSERCQVPFSMCYAHASEDRYTRKREDGRYVGPLVARRREEYLRDIIPAELYAEAFIAMNDRKAQHWAGKPFDTLRVSESGDFRSESDIIWVNTVAKILGEERDIDVYTYSASCDLDWTLATHFTVNASNEIEDYGDARFKARDPSTFEIGEGEAWCPNDFQKLLRRIAGESFDDVIKCGECRLCVDKNDIDVVIPIHADGVDKLTLDDIEDQLSDSQITAMRNSMAMQAAA